MTSHQICRSWYRSDMKYKQNKLICLCYLWIEHQVNAGTVVQPTTALWKSALSTAIGLYDGGRAPEYLNTGPPRQRWGPWIQQHRALQGPAKHQHGAPAPAPAPGVFFFQSGSERNGPQTEKSQVQESSAIWDIRHWCVMATRNMRTKDTHMALPSLWRNVHVDSPGHTQLNVTLHSSAHRCRHIANKVCVKPVVSSLEGLDEGLLKMHKE